MTPVRLRAVVTTLVPILNAVEGKFSAYAAANALKPNQAAFFALPVQRSRGNPKKDASRASTNRDSSGTQRVQRTERPMERPLGDLGGREKRMAARSRAFSSSTGGEERARSSLGGAAAVDVDQLRQDPNMNDGGGTGLTMDTARQALKTLFGHGSFRDGQEGVVSKLLAGESCAGVFPTGAGKSICYQLPGTLMAREGLGLTLVVSPLIALMKDQTDALRASGVLCAKLDSTLEAFEVRDIYEQIRRGEISLLYVSPERFNNERFVSALKGVKVALFVVDEAHCISEWGHNFRPDYLRLASFAKSAKANARLALTATATPEVTEDIANRLDIPPSNVNRTPFYRPMLNLGAVRAPDDPIERTQMLAKMLLSDGTHADGAAVVYVTLQKTAVEVAEALNVAGLDARPYHAGLSLLDREEAQDWFMNAPPDASRVIVGTIAFGMGLDKKDIRRVYHFNLPRSPEDLAQQVGRAGRDGKLATCLTLVSAADLPLLRSMIYGGTPSPAAVLGLLRTVFGGQEDECDFNFYDLSQVLDTKDLVLKTLLAHLQIRGLAREVTSYFETADVGLSDAGRALLEDGTEETSGGLKTEWIQLLGMTDAILSRKRAGSKWATLHADEAGEALGVPKTQVARILSAMADAGLIVLGKSGKIRARFKVLRRPSNREEAQSLGRDLHQMALELEGREIGRLDTVMEILCNDEGTAVSSGLSRYFGDTAETLSHALAKEKDAATTATTPPVPGQDGDERAPLSDLLTPSEVSEAEIDDLWRTGVLDLLAHGGDQRKEARGGDATAAIPCDDAYLLARFAGGIRSPRIGKLKLSQLGSFGCCAHCPFPALLTRAEEAVAAAVRNAALS